MNAVSDVAPYQAPSGMGLANNGGLFEWPKKPPNTPIMEDYMQGSTTSEVLLGMIAKQKPDPLMRKLGISGARGLMGGNDDENPQ